MTPGRSPHAGIEGSWFGEATGYIVSKPIDPPRVTLTQSCHITGMDPYGAHTRAMYGFISSLTYTGSGVRQRLPLAADQSINEGGLLAPL